MRLRSGNRRGVAVIKGTQLFGASRFTYDATKGAYLCPEGHVLQRHTERVTDGTSIHRGAAATCNACPLKACCTQCNLSRMIHRAAHALDVERVRTYQQAIRKRRFWVEPPFGETEQWHCIGQFLLRELVKVDGEAQLAATIQNLKRLHTGHGWDRRSL